MTTSNRGLTSTARQVLNPRTLGDRLFGDVAAALVTDFGNHCSGVCIDTGSGTGFCAGHGAIAAKVTADEYRIREGGNGYSSLVRVSSAGDSKGKGTSSENSNDACGGRGDVRDAARDDDDPDRLGASFAYSQEILDLSYMGYAKAVDVYQVLSSTSVPTGSTHPPTTDRKHDGHRASCENSAALTFWSQGIKQENQRRSEPRAPRR